MQSLKSIRISPLVLPKVHLNCASSLDGKIAGYDRKQIRISNDEDMKRVHLLRNSYDGILVGVGTIVSDDPKLTVKEKYVKTAKQPAVIIIDPKGRTPENALALKAEKCFVITLEGTQRPAGFPDHVQIIKSGTERINLETALKQLAKEGIVSVLVEGGGETIWGFIKANLVTSMTVYIGNLVIGGKDAPTICDGVGFASSEEMPQPTLESVERFGDGVVISYNF